jgi:hypothetical protein
MVESRFLDIFDGRLRREIREHILVQEMITYFLVPHLTARNTTLDV